MKISKKEDFRTFNFFACSHHVPNVHPKVFSIAPWFYSIWFSPKFNSHVYNLKRWAGGEYIFLYLATGVPFAYLYGTLILTLHFKNICFPLFCKL